MARFQTGRSEEPQFQLGLPMASRSPASGPPAVPPGPSAGGFNDKSSDWNHGKALSLLCHISGQLQVLEYKYSQHLKQCSEVHQHLVGLQSVCMLHLFSVHGFLLKSIHSEEYL